MRADAGQSPYTVRCAGRSPLEILHAEVGSEETIYWAGSLVQARVVVYRDDPTSDREPRCRLWVDRAGRVLRQEAALLGAEVVFVRRSDEEAVRMAAAEDATASPDDRRTPDAGVREPAA